MEPEITQSRSWKGDETYTLTLVNNKTGKQELIYPKVKGGIFVINSPTGAGDYFSTDQGAFGQSDAISISLFKLPAVMRDLVKRAEIDAVLSALEVTSGEQWELRR